MSAPDRGDGVLAVLVLYERNLDGAKPWSWLQRTVSNESAAGSLALRAVLVYDNSPRAQVDAATLGPWAEYVHDPGTGGTAAAYAAAAQAAARRGCRWMLLLDHDTALPQDFLQRASDALRATPEPEPAALLPRVLHGGRAVSPARITAFGRMRPLPPGPGAHPQTRLTGIASGALVRRDAFEAAGPLPPALWLDYVDHWLFARMQAMGHTLAVFDATLAHDLSIRDLRTLGERRWRSILDGESAFIATQPMAARMALPLRRAARAARCVLLGRPGLAVAVFSRARPQQARPDGAATASISVVMAVYNGERFLDAQLNSVLEQLDRDDELIVVDDASSDTTASLLAARTDSRMRCIRHQHNRGVRATFEHGLREATRPLVFLCDQDDVWTAGKRDRFVRAFADHPRATLVVSDARVIDEQERVAAPSFMATKGGFRRGFWSNLIRNRYLGCAMALRRHVLERALPIPPDVPQHDMWLGSIAALMGEVVFIEQPLLLYRRHGGNLSPDRPQKLGTMLRWRVTLGSAVLRRMIGARHG